MVRHLGTCNYLKFVKVTDNAVLIGYEPREGEAARPAHPHEQGLGELWGFLLFLV